MRRGARQIGMTVIIVVTMGGLLVVADAVHAVPDDAGTLERGWWNAARRTAGMTSDHDRAAIDRLQDEAERAEAERQAWLRTPRDWTVRWSRHRGPRGDAGGAVPQAPLPAAAGAVIAWSGAGAVHAVMADSGGPAWEPMPASGTVLFPRLASPVHGQRATAVTPATVATWGHLLFAVVRADEPLLACLDCSNTAEGRLAWIAPLPDGCAAFDGPPAADADLCAIVCRAADDRPSLTLLACDVRDGRVAWRRPLGTGIARDGRDHGRGARRPLLREDLVAVADHAGSVTAFTRDGRHAWTQTYEPASGGPTGQPDGHDRAALAMARDTLLAAPLDRGGLLAIDLSAGDAGAVRVRWETPAGVSTSIIGSTSDHVVIAAGGPPRLESRTVANGSLSATAAGGSAILAGDVVLQSASAADGVELTPRDIASLAALAPAFPLAVGRETDVALAAGRDALVVASPDMLFCIAPSPTPRPSSP
jgi:outer membrane protein assembly factor BamB